MKPYLANVPDGEITRVMKAIAEVYRGRLDAQRRVVRSEPIAA